MFMNAKNSDKGVNNGDVATVGDNNGGGRYVGDVDSDDDDDDNDDSFYHVSPYLAKSVGPCPNKSCKRPFYNISSSYGHGAIRLKKPFFCCCCCFHVGVCSLEFKQSTHY